MRNQAVRQVSESDVFSAPILGINARDSLANMSEGYALLLRNMYAQPYGCQVRKGYRIHTQTGLPGKVETLISHNLTTPALYAFVYDDSAGSAAMYDVTEPNVPAILKVSGLSNSRWQSVNVANAGGVNVLAVNGADDWIWIQPNGAIVRISSGDGSPNTISGVDPKACVSITIHQKRVWVVEDNTTKGWYLPPDQLFGITTVFDFGGNWPQGGALNQLIPWTIDDGIGADDHLLAISTEGNISSYVGTDPNGADTWYLKGVYTTGDPVGRRCADKYGGDVIIITVGGLVQMSTLLRAVEGSPADEGMAKNLNQLIIQAVELYKDDFGWQPFFFPGNSMSFLNIPSTEFTSFQFVINHIRSAWSEFLGYNSYCWVIHRNRPIFGTLNAVCRAWEGHTDGATIDSEGVVKEGIDILSDSQTVFNHFKSAGYNKHYKMIKPTVLSQGGFSLQLAVKPAYSFSSNTFPAAVETYVPGVWDESLWGTGRWSGGLLTFDKWQAVTGISIGAALRLSMRSRQETYWVSTAWLYEIGGVM